MVSRKVTRTNWPGHSLWSVFGKVPFSLMVPVVMSTALSTKVSDADLFRDPASSCGRTRTGSLPTAMYVLIAASCASGTAKVT